MPPTPLSKTRYRLLLAVTLGLGILLLLVCFFWVQSFFSSQKISLLRSTTSPIQSPTPQAQIQMQLLELNTSGGGLLITTESTHTTLPYDSVFKASSTLPRTIWIRTWERSDWHTQIRPFVQNPLQPHFVTQQTMLNRCGFSYAFSRISLAFGPSPSAKSRTIASMPFWALALAFAIPFIICLYRLSKHRHIARRISQNRCIACGYDLRHSPTACPECGAKTISPPQSQTAPPPQSPAPPSTG